MIAINLNKQSNKYHKEKTEIVKFEQITAIMHKIEIYGTYIMS